MRLSDADVVIINAIRQDDALYWGGFKENNGTIDQRGELIAVYVYGVYRNVVGIKIDGTDGLLNMGTEHATKFLRSAVEKAIRMLKKLEDGEITVCQEEDVQQSVMLSAASFC